MSPTMHARSRTGCLFAVCVVLAALAAVLVPAAAAPATAIGTVRICTDCATSGGDLSRYDYVVLHAWEAWRIPALRRANPRVKLLLFRNASMTVRYAGRGGGDHESPAGSGYVE